MTNELSLGNLDPKLVREDDSLIEKFVSQRAGMLGINPANYTIHYESATGRVTATPHPLVPDLDIEVT